MAVAVLIVNYRTYGELGGCLASLQPHLQSDDEVVVVDNESNREALAAAIAPFAALRLTAIPRADNCGFAAGVNVAAAASRARFLLLLNPDTIVEGPVVRALEQWLIDHADVGVVGARVLNANGSVQATARRFPDVTTWLGGRSTWLTARFPGNWLSKRNLIGLDATAPVDVDWISGACLMTPRDVFDRLAGFDEGFFLYWEDADYCARVADAGFRRMYLPVDAVRHTGGRSSDRDPIQAIQAFHRSVFRLYWKRSSLAGRSLAPVVAAGLWIRARLGIQKVVRHRSVTPS